MLALVRMLAPWLFGFNLPINEMFNASPLAMLSISQRPQPLI